MDFQYSPFFVRVVLNPQDIILRFEHKSTARIYEQTFFDRDFVQFATLGGLEFVGKILSIAFGKEKPASISIQRFQDVPSKVSFEIQYSSEVLISPLTLSFTVPAIKKQTGASDTDMIQRKFEAELTSMRAVIDRLGAVITPLHEKVKELEERCGDCIMLPGCMFGIPMNIEKLLLVKHRTQLPDTRAFSYHIPKISLFHQSINWNSLFPSFHAYGPQECPESYVFDSITSLKPLRNLKKCTDLTLSGVSDITDFSCVSEMTQLKSLTIIPSFGYNGQKGVFAPLYTYTTPTVSDPSIYKMKLTSIEWIRNLKNLEILSFHGCDSLVNITPLKDLPKLRELDIRETGVRNTDFLTNPNLKITK
jgi:hypothetical protein